MQEKRGHLAVHRARNMAHLRGKHFWSNGKLINVSRMHIVEDHRQCASSPHQNAAVSHLAMVTKQIS